MYWANFLHIYQPPTQTEEIVRKITDECYRPLVKILKENKSAKITLNINACLCEQLVRYGFSDVIDGLGELAQRGQIEFTASAKYHPILPLIPKSEIERQIELNQKENEGYFKGVYQPKGFFPPEMCYSKEVARIVKRMGFEWIIIDEVSYNGKIGEFKNDRLYYIKGLKPFKVFFKERRISAAITYGRCKNLIEFEELNKEIMTKEVYPVRNTRGANNESKISNGVYLLTGTDGEVYGHHRPGQERLLIEVFQEENIKTCTISELSSLFKNIESIEPLASSWSTWEAEIKENVPYPQWNYPGNEIHKMQWELARLAIDSVNKTKERSFKSEDWQRARKLLDEGLHSCQWWWVSCRPWWDTQMADRGADVLTQVISKLKNCGLVSSVIERAFRLKEDIHNQAMQWHISGKAKKLQDEYMKSHGDVTSLLTFG